ncbi:MAG: 6-phosphogluconate dehydrogenase [Flavobacterium sp.]|uniref:6-phosphogluconate dehydrogenase n=1 Tax=unclassified Flavobacterium TaxID=196869 RepID=UPI000C48D7C9|nr:MULTISPECIES: 6-phosphogluconate dehydrogenase [unclassified Flavobacterium]MBF04524.1 6-phosphogluconate dehydrogenase [Flavobacterium sp.]MCO6164083.1 6-phosphogluconate dehydrogenase [Flavobacterium sp. NRK F7]
MTTFKKIIFFSILLAILTLVSYMTYIYYVPYSEGVRSGELIKISKKGYFVKTWEGEISQGISGAQIFKFSVLDNQQPVIDSLKNLQGKFVKVEYVERLRTFFWWGDTRYFITKVEKETSPYFNNGE